MFEINYIFSNKYNNKFKVNYLSAEKYWKIPELTEVIFELIFTANFSIKDFTLAFDLNWLYRSSKYVDQYGDIVLNENAIWDKATHGATFLHENVVWTKIYNMN